MSRAEECKVNLLLKARAFPEGYTKVIGRGEKGLKHLEFGLLLLSGGDWSGETGNCEQVLNIYSGVVTLDTSSSGEAARYSQIGGRKNTFEDPPNAIYLPPGVSYRIEAAEGPVEAAVFSATATGFVGKPVLVRSRSIVNSSFSMDTRMLVGDEVHAAKILMGEQITPPGRWSWWPPHKHDAFIPQKETPLEEICYYQVSPHRGFGIARVYTQPNDPSPMDEVYVVENGDAIVIPMGYHVAVAAPGSTLHSTWALAGEARLPIATSPDPGYEMGTDERRGPLEIPLVD